MVDAEVENQTLHAGTRERLLEVTIAVIESRGEPMVRVKAIADEVGVASTSVYHYFGNRGGLVDAANAERYRRTLYGPNHEALRAAFAECSSQDDCADLLRHILTLANQEDGMQRRRARVAVLGSAVSRPPLAVQVIAANAEYAKDLAYTFMPAQVKGWIRRDIDLEAAVLWQIGQMTGRIMVELDPSICDLAEWDRIEADGVIAAFLGMAPLPSKF
jgi:AcrR family transcriptional regulator